MAMSPRKESVENRFLLARAGETHPLAMLPGWGFDARSFEALLKRSGPLDIGTMPAGDLPADQQLETALLEAALLECLDARHVGRVTLLGWSLGGIRALDFARKHPERVAHVLLVGLRPGFSADEIAAQRTALIADPRAALRHFYRRAFAGRKQDYASFAETIEEPLLAAHNLPTLLSGLDELRERRLKPQELSFGSPARWPVVLHGKRDLIAPLAELEALLQTAPKVRRTVLAEMGHAPFLSDRFPAWLADELARPIQ